MKPNNCITKILSNELIKLDSYRERFLNPHSGNSTFINLFNETKFFFSLSHRRSTTVSLETKNPIPCINQSPILEPKKKFFLFLGTNFLEKLIFYLRIFFQLHYG